MGSRADATRRGWAEFVGPEATRTNHVVTVGTSVVGTVGAVVLARSRGGGVGVATTVAVLDHRVDARDRWARWGLTQYGYMLLSTVLIRTLPAHRRGLGLGLTAGGLVLNRVLGPSTAVPWFAWTYYPKLLMGHAAASLWSDEELDVGGEES